MPFQGLPHEMQRSNIPEGLRLQQSGPALETAKRRAHFGSAACLQYTGLQWGRAQLSVSESGVTARDGGCCSLCWGIVGTVRYV